MYGRTLTILALLPLTAACSRESAPVAPPAATAVVSSAGRVAFSGVTGGLAGHVLLDGAVPPAGHREVTFDRDVCGAEPKEDRSLVIDGATRAIRYAVVTLTPKSESDIASTLPRSASIDHARCEFYPYVTLLAPGGSVTVTNSDRALHDLHRIHPGTDTHDSQPPSAAVPLVFPGVERTRLACDLHYFTSAWVITTAAPFATVTDAPGAFEFRGVPAGRWTLSVWHERLGEKSVEVDVPSGLTRTETILLAVPKPSPPGPAMDAGHPAP